MAAASSDLIERKLLVRLQRSFPLVPRPFEALSLELDVREDAVIALVRNLKDRGFVRQIGPVVDGRRLGYQSTLVASEVPQWALAGAEATLSGHPGVSHAYERDHKLNIWFTLSLRAGMDVEKEVRNLGVRMGAEQAFSLPALRLFKIGAFFGAEADLEQSVGHAGLELPQEVPISRRERMVIKVLQEDLPLTSAPFDHMAELSGMTTPDFLACCESLVERGVIRRFGASVNHRKAGYEGNGMACWQVTAALVEPVGSKLAAISQVSHCYERRTNPAWKYNLFAMFHGGTPDACRSLVKNAAESIGMPCYSLLFSTREIRKTRVKYLA